MHHRIRDHTDSILPGLIHDESEITAGVRVRPGRRYGFFTDTSVCIGCKACEVACKEWNLLPVDNYGLTGHELRQHPGARRDDVAARGVRRAAARAAEGGPLPTVMPPFQSGWRMMSDVCKHCWRAGCLEACPTGACSAPSSARLSSSRTSATAAAIASSRARSASSN